MKKVLCFVLFTGVMLFTSCSVPYLKSPDITAIKSDVSEIKDAAKTEVPVEKDLSPGGNNLTKDIDKAGNDKNIVGTVKTIITAYYQDAEGLIIPITRKIVKTEGIARASVQSLIDNEANREQLMTFGVLPVLPAATEIRGISIKDRTAVIDFNASLLDYKDLSAEKNIISSIVYTVTEFTSIENVRILINGTQQQKLKWGTDISGVLKRDNILINSNKVNLSNGMTMLNIFYVKSLNNKSVCVLPVTKEFNVVKTELLPEKIIEYLSDKTSDERYFSEIPLGTKLVSSKINGDLLVLNFNKSLVEYGGNTREDGIVKQLLYSMKQIKGVKKIKILIDGKAENLPEGTDISKELEVPQEINTTLTQ